MEYLIDLACVMDFQSMKNSFEYHNHQKYAVCIEAEDDLTSLTSSRCQEVQRSKHIPCLAW